jgi:DNA methylase
MGRMNTSMTLHLEVIEFVKELYPRLREDEATIERYRLALDRLPPITIARGCILVDGFHRLQAHKREGKATIQAEDLGDLSDTEIFNESIRRNATHGHQLSAKDKQHLAGKLWHNLAHLPPDERTSTIMDLLAVSQRSVYSWTKDARAYEKQQLQERAFDLWLNCLTQEVIADQVGVPQQTISRWLLDFANLQKWVEPPGATKDNPWGHVQHFDIWTFPQADGDSHYFGKMPPQVVENLLWFYTNPGDIVVDPCAGGGTTIDVCKAMGRRCWASDLTPATPMLPIHQHDITTGWPAQAPAKARLILLDPPYWQQAKGRYSDKPADLGNMDLDAFMDAWQAILTACAGHLEAGGHLAYIIAPSVNGDTVHDHALEMARVAHTDGWTIAQRIIVPYQTQRYTEQQITWAREHKQLLNLFRDLIILYAA